MFRESNASLGLDVVESDAASLVIIVVDVVVLSVVAKEGAEPEFASIGICRESFVASVSDVVASFLLGDVGLGVPLSVAGRAISPPLLVLESDLRNLSCNRMRVTRIGSPLSAFKSHRKSFVSKTHPSPSSSLELYSK